MWSICIGFLLNTQIFIQMICTCTQTVHFQDIWTLHWLPACYEIIDLEYIVFSLVSGQIYMAQPSLNTSIYIYSSMKI